MDGQLSIFDFLKPEPIEKETSKILSVGDKVGKVILGECRTAVVTKVEGLPNHPFYRTDRGICFSYKDGLKSVEDLLAIAEAERRKYKTVVPESLSNRITVEYEPRQSDGKVLWAQIGIYENMLFWKEDITYQFLIPFDSEKKMLREYEKHRKSILDDTYGKVSIVEKEKPMRRLYWSKHGFYADAEYVDFNG